MTSTETGMPHTFHFRFSEVAERAIARFAEDHQKAPRLVYKGAWAHWKSSNAALIEKEEQRLRGIGYTGDVEDKMYKAGRYYFGRTRLRRKPDQPRRDSVVNDAHRYRRVDKDVLQLMDRQISSCIRLGRCTPQQGLARLLEAEATRLGQEMLRMERDWGMSREDAADKIKRTYKNRYHRERRAATRLSRGVGDKARAPII